MKTTLCPNCGASSLPIEEEVDIGVGIQTFLVGIYCPNCRELAICPSCGAAGKQEHERWCNELKDDIQTTA